ncbi:hypothetical protein [Peribacillus butanolivorans]|nr:hypothetical protein [Peribacillus butanolivorans]
MNHTMKTIVIIGGGITGLAAEYSLQVVHMTGSVCRTALINLRP